MKPKLSGIEIYAGVDAYSQFIPIYVGITARIIAISVLRSYIDSRH